MTTQEMSPMLPVVGLTEFDARDLCDGVWFVGRFQGTRQEGLFSDGVEGRASGKCRNFPGRTTL